MNLELDNRLQISDPVPPLPPPPSSAGAISAAKTKKAAPKKAKAAPSKYNVKPKDPKRDTSVPFDEMKRLMRVYGSLVPPKPYARGLGTDGGGVNQAQVLPVVP